MTSSQPAMTNNQTVTRPAARTVSADDKVIIAIDAGHGGQDPGAIGPNGTKEKNVTIAIARKLRALLNADPQFKPVLTRDGDYFISVMGRSDVARKQTPISSSLSMLTPRQTAMPLAPRCGCSRTVAPTAKWPVGSSSMRNSLNCSAVRAMCWQTARPTPT